MCDPNYIVELLRTEYGITNVRDLERAIAKQTKLDITPFCGEMNKKRSRRDEIQRT